MPVASCSCEFPRKFLPTECSSSLFALMTNKSFLVFQVAANSTISKIFVLNLFDENWIVMRITPFPLIATFIRRLFQLLLIILCCSLAPNLFGCIAE